MIVEGIRAAALRADAQDVDSAPETTWVVGHRRRLQLASSAVILAMVAAVIAGTLIDQRAVHPASAGAAAKLSGRVYPLSGQVKGLKAAIHDPDGQAILSAAFSPDGRMLAVGDGNGTVFWWNLASRWSASSAADPDSGGIYSVAFSPDGRTIAAGDGNGTTYLRDVGTGRLSAQVAVSGAVSSATFSRSGRMLAIGDIDGGTYLWNVTAKGLVSRPTTRVCFSVSSVAFSASGRTLAVGCDDGSVCLWNLVTGRAAAAVSVLGADGMIAVAFGQGDRKVAAVDEALRLYLWDVVTRHLTLIARGVDSVAFSPDGRTLAAGTTDGKVCLWSLSGHLIATRTDPDSAGVRSVAFSPDGRTIAAGDSNGLTYLWNAS